MIRRNKTNKKKKYKKINKNERSRKKREKEEEGKFVEKTNGGKRKKNLGKKRMKEYIKLAVIFGV